MKASVPKLIWACVGTLLGTVVLTVMVVLLFVSPRWPVLRTLTAIRAPLGLSLLTAVRHQYRRVLDTAARRTFAPLSQ
jgi:di/tricarboxylate transporter